MTSVSAIIVTRGDVDLTEILASLPDDWEKIVWDNGLGRCINWTTKQIHIGCGDRAVYGRYAAIEYASGDLIFVQDDDCVIENAQEIVYESDSGGSAYGQLVCNLPKSRWPEFPDSCLVGWGSAFHRDLPNIALGRFAWYYGVDNVLRALAEQPGLFLRECDIVFTTLTPHVKIDVGFRHLPWAEGPGRMFTADPQKHREERQLMLELCRKIRDDRRDP
jgi:hypothetical protein